MSSLRGRTALVTGAGRGLGRALALGLAERGAEVVLVARSEAELAHTAELATGATRVLATDLGDPAQVAALLHRVGPVDVLVNNAAVTSPVGATAEVDPAEFAAAIAINLTAPVTLTLGVLPGMLARGWGRVVNVSSGVTAHPGALVGGNAYTTTKAALEAHSHNLAAELAGSGVTVNVYQPGMVDTAMQAAVREDRGLTEPVRRGFVDAYKTGVLISPETSARGLLDHLPGDDNGATWIAPGF
ncbi:SDR family oxidoreductase [Amycolatopsis rhabdoformis]|uniref:SDR family oxidoreductase n=1 Tax=Amycolatopsis rhabdoformis TaxID=1448059 RepID=A0ABZ1I6T4_9PSEU|nr:SDR family oxidoreductase [Amycolatopsis rhabdoformis]WSE30103.1 SDR family oxidoreductase [Amycolatopsis rhabdoformis]